MDLNPMNYPRFGLSHSLGYLDSLKPQIAWYSIDEQSKCADAITKRYHADPTFISQNRVLGNEAKWEKTVQSGRWNATGIGNLAYCVTAAPDDAIKQEALDDYNYAISKLQERYPVSDAKRTELLSQTVADPAGEPESQTPTCVIQ